MTDLALLASGAEASEAADLLRELHDLLCGDHSLWGDRGDFIGAAARFDALLAADACASAALLLIAGRSGYMVSQGPGGRVIATVTLGQQGGEVSSAGADVALALIGALAQALAEVPAATLSAADPARRLVQPEQVSLRLN